MVDGDLLDALPIGLLANFVPRMLRSPKTVSSLRSRPVSIRLKIAADVIGLLTLAIRKRLEVVNGSRESRPVPRIS